MMSDLIKEASMIGDVNEKISRLDGFVKRLEDELRKFDAFKRELPFSMLLLKDAIECLKGELMRLQCVASTKNQQPVLEEFIPLKRSGEDHSENSVTQKDKDFIGKKSWISSVQLWNSDDHSSKDSVFKQKLEPKTKSDQDRYENGEAFWVCKSKSKAMVTMPFEVYPCLASIKEGHREDLPVPGLSFLTPGIKSLKEESGSAGLRVSCSKRVSSSADKSQFNLHNGSHSQPSQQQTGRKQRRCWSSELHRRFVNSLDQLGGCKAATPKQIRELMQVDGLTNDEVKSHLQKYRLHNRKMPNSTATPGNKLGLGDLLMSQDQYSDSSKRTSSQSGSPEGLLQFVRDNARTSMTGGDIMEDEDDGKSEGYIHGANSR